MEWTSESIVIKQQQFGDDKLLCWFFSATQGVYKGFLNTSNKTRNQIQLGNIVHATWRARLAENLGSYYYELVKPLSMSVITDKQKLSSILSICSILTTALPERVCEEVIYDKVVSYLLSLKDHANWLKEYLHLELNILSELGYGLNLTSCAATGTKENLFYISPKTGCAVSLEAGKAYHDKLFILPKILTEEIHLKSSIEQAYQALHILQYFLRKNIYKPHGQELPKDRVNFYNTIMHTQ